MAFGVWLIYDGTERIKAIAEKTEEAVVADNSEFCFDPRPITETSLVEGITERIRAYHWRAPNNKNATIHWNELTDAILMIEGVASTTPYAYKITVSKATAYTWDEIEPKIIKLLQVFEAVNAPDPELEVEGDV